MTGRAPTDDGGLPLSDWKRIDALCDRFEAACEAGERPDPAAFLEDMKGPAAERLFRELLAIDLESSRDRGELPEAPAYRERFPAHIEAIDEAFAHLGSNGPALHTLEPRVGRPPSAGESGWQLTEIGTALRRAELNEVVLEALRSAGYLVLGELGRGGMGVVYLARKVALNRLCALKMVLAGAHAGPIALARFRAEAEAIARLTHPDIVQIYHIGETEGLPFLELEYLSGGSLDQMLDGSPRVSKIAAGLVEIMARAIAEAHRRGIVHRDLKPANVLLDANGRPKVADFGLAKILGSDGGLTKTSAVLGSPSYMAPEQAEGNAELIGPTTDVYALGAILYELLTGRPPFRAATALETLAQVKDADPVPLTRLQPGLPRDVETICMKCLEKSPGRRYATALDLAEDLRRFLAGEPILAHQPPFWERAWKRARRRPALAAALTFSAAAVVLLLVGTLYFNTQLHDSVRKAQAAEQAALEQRNLSLKTLYELVFGLQEKYGNSPATRQIRQGLLDTAIAGLDQIARSTEAAPPDIGRAVANQKLGDIFRQIGRSEDARRQYDASRELAIKLEAASPRDLAIAECLSRTYAGLGELSLQADRNEEAVKHLSQVVALAERCAEINPDHAQARGNLLEAYFRLGRAYGFNRELDRADVWFRKMHDLAEQWASLEPDNILARDLLATSFRKLADIRKLAGDDVAAQADYARAIALGQKLLLAEPTNLDVKVHLALALDDQAMTLSRLGRLEEAGPLSRQAEQLFTELVQIDPDDIDNRLRLLQTQFDCGCIAMDELQIKAALARIHGALDGLRLLDRDGTLEGRPRDKSQLLPRFKDEMAACQAVAASPGDLAALRSDSARETCRLLRIRAGVMAEEGRVAEFAATAQALCELDAREPEDLYRIGRSLAWCAGRIDRIGGTATTGQDLKPLKQRCENRAVAALVQAIDSGLRDPGRLKHEPDLTSVREHVRFRQLIERLTGPDPAPKAAADGISGK